MRIEASEEIRRAHVLVSSFRLGRDYQARGRVLNRVDLGKDDRSEALVLERDL